MSRKTSAERKSRRRAARPGVVRLPDGAQARRGPAAAVLLVLLLTGAVVSPPGAAAFEAVALATVGAGELARPARAPAVTRSRSAPPGPATAGRPVPRPSRRTAVVCGGGSLPAPRAPDAVGSELARS